MHLMPQCGYRVVLGVRFAGGQLARNFSSVTMCRLVDSPVYQHMSSELAAEGVTSALDTASKYILDSNLVVNKRILDLHIVKTPQGPMYEIVKAMKTSGAILTGRYTFKHDEIIKNNYTL